MLYLHIYYFDQAYLARLRGSPSGLVSWEIDFTASGLVIDTVTVVTRCVTMETGKVDWRLEGNDDIVQDLTFSSGMYDLKCI